MRQLWFLIVRFGLGGGAATLTYALLSFGFSQWTAATDMAAHISAFCLAIPVSYLIQRNFVFRDAQSMRRTLPLFIATAVFAFILSTSAIYVCRSILMFPELTSFAVAVIAVVVANFLLLFFWVFVEAG